MVARSRGHHQTTHSLTCTWRVTAWRLGFDRVAVSHNALRRLGTATGKGWPVAALKSRSTISSLRELVPLVHPSSNIADVIAALHRGESGAIDGAWGSACALVNAALACECPETLLIVLPRASDLDLFAADLATFHGEAATLFPAWESLPDEHEISDTIFGSRLRVLNGLRQSSPLKLLLTTFPALLQPVPARKQLQDSTRQLAVGDELEIEALIEWLVQQGCRRVPVIDLPGEVSHHGGILDIFAPGAEHPIRIELFGDEIESMRWFDTETQQQIEQTDSVELTFVAPATNHSDDRDTSRVAESRDADSFVSGESLLDSLPPRTWVSLVSLGEMLDEGQQYLSRLPDRKALFTVEQTMARLTDFPSVTVDAIGADSTEVSCLLRIESVERFSTGDVMSELETLIGSQESVVIACHNEGERVRLAELLESTSIAARVDLCLGEVSRGFRLVDERMLVLSDHELFGRREILRRERPAQSNSRAIDSFLDLNPGDLVVHVAKGIARYRGMQLLEKGDQVEEHLVLEFRDGVRVYVPVSLIQLVQKYVGAARSSVDLSKLGTSAWSRKKQRVADAVDDMASEMIRFQAEREAKPGIAFPGDTNWQVEFEAAFPYHETRDQVEAISDSKQDMQRARPMDRLICGDVGYGKTEVAMRAAFKAVCAGFQVAVLVPTTVLAEQHLRTFCERMAQFPVTIAGLSRFKSKAQQRETVEGLATGAVDIVIGTHRLIQKDIRFHNLGLLIIDEEQRFGVGAKEMLKKLRLEIDVLTLTATPIPRTLHLSLMGIRDISNLQTAPRDRMAIETRVCRFDKSMIRSAIVREMNRGGQVYFVHNRVYNIQSVADAIQSIVPEASIAIAHGQMKEQELEQAMLSFVSGGCDILVATTIIESGLDIPNANTIFIHQADIYGLADLHQLRGRVGRHHHRAYCYLIPSKGRVLTGTAAKRLKAIEEYSELGAGFKIAMRDLEIRGAGNILGTEQSGHICSIGYELYCQLLENSVRRLQGLPERKPPRVSIDLPVSAFLPHHYVPPGRQKIEMYRRFSSILTLDELQDFNNELRDRFGALPQEVARMEVLKRLQLLAHSWKIEDIHLEDGYAVFGYQDRLAIQQLEQRCDGQLRVVDRRQACLVLESDTEEQDELLEELVTVLSD